MSRRRRSSARAPGRAPRVDLQVRARGCVLMLGSFGAGGPAAPGSPTAMEPWCPAAMAAMTVTMRRTSTPSIEGRPAPKMTGTPVGARMSPPPGRRRGDTRRYEWPGGVGPPCRSRRPRRTPPVGGRVLRHGRARVRGRPGGSALRPLLATTGSARSGRWRTTATGCGGYAVVTWGWPLEAGGREASLTSCTSGSERGRRRVRWRPGGRTPGGRPPACSSRPSRPTPPYAASTGRRFAAQDSV